MSRALLQKELDGQIASIYADREREYIVEVDLLELSLERHRHCCIMYYQSQRQASHHTLAR